MPNIQYPDATGQSLTDFIGTLPNVCQWGAKPDCIYTEGGSVTASDNTLTMPAGTFSDDPKKANYAAVGKRVLIFGAGSGADPETYLRSSAAVFDGATSDAVLVSADCQSATKIKVGVAARLYGITWSLYGADAPNYSDESSVHGPIVTAIQGQDFHTIATPTKRYYRVKFKNTVSGEVGTAYAGLVAYGRVLGTTIASYTSSTSIELTDAPSASISNAHVVFGTDNTVAIQKALDTVGARNAFLGGADGGMSLLLPAGAYLISSMLTVPKRVELKGHSSTASILVADASIWPAYDADYGRAPTGGSPMVQLGPLVADHGVPNPDFGMASGCRLVDLRLDAKHAVGSMGVYSESVQENSGIIRCTIIGWTSKGIRFHWYGCQHWMMDDLWIFPSDTCYQNDDAIGLELDTTIDPNPIRKATVYANGGYCADYGTAVRFTNCNADINQIHTENAKYGVYFDTGSNGTIWNNSPHPLVTQGIRINTSNAVYVVNSGANGSLYNIWDETLAIGFIENSISQYAASGGQSPIRFRGNNFYPLLDIMEVIPGAHVNGNSTIAFDRYGHIRLDGGDKTAPNVLTLCSLNYAASNQGGWLAVNSRPKGYPNWEQTSTNAETQAMFMRLGAQLFELRFGDAANALGTNPGTRALSVSPTEVKMNRLWFWDTEELGFGNNLGTHRMRLTQGDTNQAIFYWQRSQDSGSTWANLVKGFLADDVVQVLGAMRLYDGAIYLTSYAGDPNTHVSAPAGSACFDTNGAFWGKTGTGATGWVQSLVSSAWVAGDNFWKIGQGANNHLAMGWTYNATPASAYADIYTASYNNPLRIDAQSLILGSQATGMKVGVGGAPSTKFHIYSAANADLVQTIESASTSAVTVCLKFIRSTTGAASLWWLGTGVNSDSGFHLYDYPSTKYRLSVLRSGYVGVNYATPTAEMVLNRDGSGIQSPELLFLSNTTTVGSLRFNGTDFELSSPYSNANIVLSPAGTGRVKFGTLAQGAALLLKDNGCSFSMQLGDATPKFTVDSTGSITLCLNASIAGTLSFGASTSMTASRPMLTNGSKLVVSGLIDLSSASFVAASAIVTGMPILYWDGEKCGGLDYVSVARGGTGATEAAGARAGLNAAENGAPSGGAATLTLYGPNTNGSISFNSSGSITGSVNPT
jgi:hypothetical protein